MNQGRVMVLSRLSTGIVTFSALLLTSVSSFAETKVIYGVDNRKDLSEVRNPIYQKLAKSTAAMVSTSFLYQKEDGHYQSLMQVSLEEGMNICSSERFAQQPMLANCSGFLIADDLLVTAGHCLMAEEMSCKSNSWVFDYDNFDGDYDLNHIDKSTVYKCKEIVGHALNDFQDYAVIRLDRKVTGREPLRIRTSGKVSESAPLVVIGHPSMLPAKVTDGGSVLDNNDPFKFITSLDTFQGNSGSAVFNANTGIVEGILVNGKTDYIHSDPNDPLSCLVVNECSQDGKECVDKSKGSTAVFGEGVTRIAMILRHL